MKGTPITPITFCEHCGRPSEGADKCPHAINSRYQCPRDERLRDLHERLRRLGH